MSDDTDADWVDVPKCKRYPLGIAPRAEVATTVAVGEALRNVCTREYGTYWNDEVTRLLAEAAIGAVRRLEPTHVVGNGRGDCFIVDDVFARHEGFDEALLIVELAPGLDGGVTVFVAPPAPFDAKVKQEAERLMRKMANPHIAELTAERDAALAEVAVGNEAIELMGKRLAMRNEWIATKDARIAELEKQLAAFTAANVAPAPEPAKPEHNPFRDFPTDPRRLGR